MLLLQVLLCSLTGDIFPKEQQPHQQPHGQPRRQPHQQLGNSSLKSEHLRQMLRLVTVWLPDPQAAVHQAAANEEAPLLDACRYAHVYMTLAVL